MSAETYFNQKRDAIKRASSTEEMLTIMSSDINGNVEAYKKNLKYDINKKFHGNLEKSREYFIRMINQYEETYYDRDADGVYERVYRSEKNVIREESGEVVRYKDNDGYVVKSEKSADGGWVVNNVYKDGNRIAYIEYSYDDGDAYWIHVNSEHKNRGLSDGYDTLEDAIAAIKKANIPTDSKGPFDYGDFDESYNRGKFMENKTSKKLLSLYERAGKMFEKEFEYSKEERDAFMEAVRNYERFGESVYGSKKLAQAVKEISELVELANSFTLKETDGWFDNVTTTRHVKQMKEAVKVLQKEAEEIMSRQQRLEAAYEDIGQLLGRYYDV